MVKQQQLFNSLWLASTTAVLAIQPVWADTVQVTAVRIKPTVSGIKVLLETPKNASARVFTSSHGEVFVADITNTHLRLPTGNAFRASNPADGITKVTVMPLHANSIRVTVTAKAGLSVEEVVQSDENLALSLSTGTSLAQAPIHPSKSDKLKTTSTPSRQSQNRTHSADHSKRASDNRKSKVAQSAPTPTPSASPELPNSDVPTQPTPAPSYLNPSPDPLQFPTRPDEVRIQGTQPITLQQAFELARRNNRTLQIAELTLERDRAALRQAEAALYPTVNASVQVSNSGNAFINGFPSSGGGSSSSGSSTTGSTSGGSTGGLATSGSSTTGSTSGGSTGGSSISGSSNTASNIGVNTTGTTGTTGTTTTGTTGTTTTGTTGTTGTTTTGGTTTAGVISTAGGSPASTSSGTGGTAGANIGSGGTGSTSSGGGTGSTSSGGGSSSSGSLSYPRGKYSSTALTGTVALNYNLYTSGSRTASIRSAKEQVRYDQLGVEIAAEQLRLDVSSDYYNLQSADQQVRIYQAAVVNAQASLRDAQAQERAGVGTRFDVLRSQVQLANSTQNLTNSLANQQTARRQLAQRLSVALSVDISAADPVQIAGLWNLSLEDSIILAFKNRAELSQYLALRNISEQNRRLALATLGPQVSLTANYNLNDTFATSYNNSFPTGALDSYAVGAVVNLLLFDGGAAKANAAQAEANKAIAETNFANERNLVRFDVEQYYASLQSNLANIQTSSIVLSQAREALRLARLRFQAGVGTQTDVISAENDLTNTEGTRVNAILNYNKSLASLQRSVSSGRPR